MNREAFDVKEADRELDNWGRHFYDSRPGAHLLYAKPPTSEQYVAPVVGFDDPEPVKAPIDIPLAEQTERIVVHIGLESADCFYTLVHWYTNLMRGPLYSVENRTDYALGRLAKKMHTGPDGARRMLEEARYRYWLHRELQRLTVARKFARISGGS